MLIKQIGHILLSLFLLISTTGVAIHKHYSGKHLYSTSLFVEAKSCCEIPCDCCNKTSTVIQVKENFVPSYFHLDDVAELVLLVEPLLAFLMPLETQALEFSLNFWDSSPPLLSDLCILNQVFRL
ncbi:MAG: hypothetical protein ACEPOZ_13520 [Marinifilaceae bacterium]